METPSRFGRYHVLGPIARGGMAEVFRVKTVGLAGFEKIQALKRIAPAQSHEPRFIRSFIDEARIAAELAHKNVVQVFDFGEVDGVLYLTMELIDGCDLRTALDRARAAGLVMPTELAAHVVAEVGNGLDYAHRKADASGQPLGIVHCDVSPANVMVSNEGHVKILDFGVARASFAHALERRRLRGKPRYMAPEQTRGEQPTPATDVFALGLVAWELLTGAPLFDGTDVTSTLAAVRTMPVPPVDRVRPEVPLVLARALERALVRDPDGRGTAIELTRAAALAAGGASARGLAAWLAEVEAATVARAAAAEKVGAAVRPMTRPPAPEATADTVTRSRVTMPVAAPAAVPIATGPAPTTPLRRPVPRPLAALEIDPPADDEEPSAVTALVETRPLPPRGRRDPFGWRGEDSGDSAEPIAPPAISQGTVDAAFAAITGGDRPAPAADAGAEPAPDADGPFAADTPIGIESPFGADTPIGVESPFGADTPLGVAPPFAAGSRDAGANPFDDDPITTIPPDATTDIGADGFEIVGEEIEVPLDLVADAFGGNTENVPADNADATIDQSV